MSAETKVAHTPGPWTVYDQSLDDGPGYGCHVRSMTDSLSDWIAQDVMNRADARLIAAAPDLLQVAKLVAEHFAYTDAPLGAAARTAIAKAEGR